MGKMATVRGSWQILGKSEILGMKVKSSWGSWLEGKLVEDY